MARDLDLDLGSGHTAYRRALLVDLYLHAKFHSNRRNILWTDGRTNMTPALLGRQSRPKNGRLASLASNRLVTVPFRDSEQNGLNKRERVDNGIAVTDWLIPGYLSAVHRPDDVGGRSVSDKSDTDRVLADVKTSYDVPQEVADRRPVGARTVAVADGSRTVDDQHEVGTSKRAQTCHCDNTTAPLRRGGVVASLV